MLCLRKEGKQVAKDLSTLLGFKEDAASDLDQERKRRLLAHFEEIRDHSKLAFCFVEACTVQEQDLSKPFEVLGKVVFDWGIPIETWIASGFVLFCQEDDWETADSSHHRIVGSDRLYLREVVECYRKNYKASSCMGEMAAHDQATIKAIDLVKQRRSSFQ